ncbi:transcriptional regulator with XRE-family HTH domain [Metabacillus crassostreae]|uniref:helix-turn-helix transcriptional regulator n=1 Tax=Metabacillus crassostreae TaxID=929098 RepID=UPI0019591480|nr:helix-turn-helix transcriptional regulator [Metabacillus crassostreae]MBM7606022.1 transcriptional regulator with XRE-family HTH domain [Metabacillus crassostreae]
MKSFNNDYIKQRRIELELTLQEMADSMGFKNASTYMKYENGTYAFKAEHLPLLSKTLKCKIVDFFNNEIAKIEIISI